MIPSLSNPISASSEDLSLYFLVKEPRVKSGRKRAIILLHGVGSNERDLFSLASQLPEDFYIISPRGPFTLGPDRFAWYNVDFSTGKPVYDVNQEALSRKTLLFFVERVEKQFDLDEVYLGGFSQGAIMSYSVGLTNPKQIKGIIALSGRLLEEIRPLLSVNSDIRNLKIFIAHGIQDSTLPIHFAREAQTYLGGLGLDLSYREYLMGHQITPAVLDDINSWLLNKSPQPNI